MSKLKVTTVNVVRKMEEQTVYTYPSNTNKNSSGKDTSDNLTTEASTVQEAKKYFITPIMKNKFSCYLNCLGIVTLYALDCLLTVCGNKWFHNVVIAVLTVCVEVFVVMVLAASTVLTTIIMNVDEAYKNYGRKDNIHSEISGDETSSMFKFPIVLFSESALTDSIKNDGVDYKQSSQDLSVKEDSDIDETYNLDGHLSNEDVIESFATKLIKNKLFMVPASEN